MEYILIHGYDKDSLLMAYNLFEQHYRQFWGPEMDEANAPKNPGNAMLALAQYVKEYQADKHIVHFTEVAGTVPIDDKHIIHFKIDSILEIDDMIRSREHKTGSTLSRVWEDQWSLSMQTGVYNHVLCCLYPVDVVWGVEINGVFFQKKENKFKRVPARRSTTMMNVWLWNTIHQLNMIDFEFQRLEDCKEGERVMEAFPMNTGSCTKYYGCKYHDFCMSWANPLQHIYEVPIGFKVEHWDPREEEKKAKKIVNIERRG
jgi:hypothetical protein